PTLKNVRLGVDTLRLISFPEERIRLCLNRADADAAMRKPQIEGALGLDVSFQLPNVPEVPAAVNRGTPLTLEAPTSPFSLAVRSMSRSLLGAARKWSPDSAEPQAERDDLIHRSWVRVRLALVARRQDGRRPGRGGVMSLKDRLEHANGDAQN